jgi:hypothetical protein
MPPELLLIRVLLRRFLQDLNEEAGYTSMGTDRLVFASCVSFSIPGRDIAIFLKRLLTLCPAFADVSINMIFSCVA